MEYIPTSIHKTVSFNRLAEKNVSGYEIYATHKDDSEKIITELIDVIEYPKYPQPFLVKKTLEYNDNATWTLPSNILLDRDYQFRLYLNDFLLNHMCYNYNRITKKVTLDTVIKKYGINDIVTIEYYEDRIVKTYTFEEDCTINVKPIFRDDSSYGYHNIIV